METKHWYMSKSIWGSVIVMMVMLLRLLSKTQEAEVIEAESGAITDWIIGVITMAGAALALFGRVTAKKVIE